LGAGVVESTISTKRKRQESNLRGALATSLRLAPGHHYRSVTLPAEERGGIEPLALVRLPRFSRPVTGHSVALSAGGLSRNRTPLLGFGDQAGPRPQPTRRPQCARSESNRARPLIERLHDPRATGAIVDYSVVRERVRCATNLFGDEDSNLDEQGQSLPACH
jgi:hypothetical protein